MKKTALAIAAATTLAFATAPIAAQAGEGEKKMDMDKKEHQSSMSDASFDDMDKNQDGMLDEDEINEYGATSAGQGSQSGEEVLEQLDEDGDDSVSREEMKKATPVPSSEDRENPAVQ